MSKPPLFKIAVSAFIVRDKKLLILKRADDENFLPGTWEVPGGSIDNGETIEHGVARETMEEAAIEIHPQKLFGYFEYVDGKQQDTVNLNFLCTMVDPSQEAICSGEMKEAAWVTLNELENYTFTSDVMLKSCMKALEMTDGKI